MLRCKTKFTIVSRAVCVVLICGLLLFGASSYAVTDVSSDFALAPPLATKPPCEIVRNADGSFGVVTNTDVIELLGRETVRSVRQDETLGKTFRNRWTFVDVGYLIARMLILTQEHKLRNPKDILIPLIKKHIRNRDGEAEILLEGFNIDGIEELLEGQAITGFALPVTRHGFPAYRLVYNLQSGEINIPMKGGKNVYVSIESAITEELSPQSTQAVVDMYLALKGEAKKEKAEFMARYGDTFNNIFMQRLKSDPSDNEALFYFTQVRDLEVFYQIQRLRVTVAKAYHRAIDDVLRMIQTGIVFRPIQDENATVVGYTEKHRLNNLYEKFVLPLVQQINQRHPVKITQYAAADGTTSVDLAELLQQEGIIADVLSTDVVINLHIIYGENDRSSIGIFDESGNLIQIKYKGKCYLPKHPSEKMKHTVHQLNIFDNTELYAELSSRLSKQFKSDSASRVIFSRIVVTDNPRVSFASRDIFSLDYREEADIVIVANLFQNFSPSAIQEAMYSLARKIKDGAYIVALRESKYRKEYAGSIWQKQGDKLTLLKGDYLTDLSVINTAGKRPETHGGATVLLSVSERIHATNFQDTLAYIQAQPQAQPLIVALGTSWIKGYEKGRYLQYDALNPLIGSLRVYCESKGIPFIVDDDDKLLARINTERAKEGKTNAKVVVLAGENIVKSDEFAPLRNDEKNAFVVGINNQELTTDSYIRLMEMLTLALKLCAGLEVSLDNAHITITKDNERHLYIFLPHAEPMDYEQLRQIYRVQEFA